MNSLRDKHAAWVADFLATKSETWIRRTRMTVASNLKRFHAWHGANGIELDGITLADVNRFVACPGGQPATAMYQKTNIAQIRSYLLWLYAEGLVTFDPATFWPKYKMYRPEKAPDVVAEYCGVKAPEWRPKTIENARSLLGKFYRWLYASGLILNQLTLEEIKGFAAFPIGNPVAVRSARINVRMLRLHLVWLYAEGRSQLDPCSIWPSRKQWVRRKSSPVVAEFLADFPRSYKSMARYKSTINHFHEWHESRGGTSNDLSSQAQRDFLGYLADEGYVRSNLYTAAFCLRVYFRWLKDEKGVSIGGADAIRDNKMPVRSYVHYLPPYATRFLTVIAANARDSTVANHRNSVCYLHRFIDSRGIAIENFGRTEAEDWIVDLKVSGASPMWRRAIIYNVRVYLAWLREQKLVTEDPDHLLRRSDLPARPKYLPRPLPPEIDRILLGRLRGSDDIFHLGLLVLRLTGIRIGELLSLPTLCTYRDSDGHTLLKVPLGKLNNERLIPIESEAEAAIDALRRIAQRGAQTTGSVAPPAFLVQTAAGRRPVRVLFRVALYDVCKDLATADPITVHRLRHTFATSLLNGGMNLVSVMRMLGHRSLKMTLMYAAVSPDTIRDEYFAALATMQNRYEFRQKTERDDLATNPVDALSDVIAWMKKEPSARSKQRKHELLLKRLHRLRDELQDITSP